MSRTDACEPIQAATEQEVLAELRRRLGAVHGPAFWRELEEQAARPELRGLLEREFPALFARAETGLERRDFLRLMGASLGVMGVAACTRQPDEKIVPFARSPEYSIPGRPRFFASAFALGESATGVLVESHMGRPTKIEGNPDHPSSLGATDALAQAAILSLYDPDRSHACLRGGQIDTWSAFATELGGRLENLSAHQGEGLGVLHAGDGSPFLTAQLARLARRLPRMRVYRWSALHRDHARAGAEAAFGRDVGLRLNLEKARVIVTLEADLLGSEPGAVRHARDFARMRPGRSWAAGINRLYAIESGLSLTGSMADERLTLRPSELEGFARSLALELGLRVEAREPEPRVARFVQAVARDLNRNRRAGIVVAGRGADPVVHLLAHRINARLENVGSTVLHVAPLEGDPPWNGPTGSSSSSGSTRSIGALAEDARRGTLDTLVILSGNPVYDAPAELELADALRQVPFRVHLATHVDETSELCHWHIPETHWLERWSDARGHDGTVTIVQPLIAPLYEAGGAKSPHELVALLSGDTGSAYELLRAYWQASSGKQGPEFETFWRHALHDGVVAGTAFPPQTPASPSEDELPPPEPSLAGLELAFTPDPSTHDGRFANNAWLQELPRPVTRIVWDNPAALGPRTAEELGLASGDVVRLKVAERTLEVPVLVVPGHAERVLTLALGNGRRSAGTLGSGVGCDAYTLRTSAAPWRTTVEVERTGERRPSPCVQKHPDQEHRDLVRVATFERFKKEGALAFAGSHAAPDAGGAPHDELRPPSLYPGFAYEGNAWGMVIDLNACIGCNACMLACQAENNVPVVGPEEVANGREMHWIRIDRYFEGEGDALQVLHQPVPCMHCENAPCETVCPVGATVHSDEGLNEMVYNRCIGTRYCSNNCPYKVRRFNFHSYTDRESESLKLGRNPDVTVRSRGVMEKCTYCVQRISQARIQAKKDGRGIRDGQVVSACQGVCPTAAITFGDINDPESAVSKLRAEPHHYGLLAELGTRPRTTYLARLRNPNPELAE